MDIASAKQQIKNTVQIYLQKDALGRYRLPLVHQRPIFLLGAPGLGKTAIMQQVADEMGLGLVSYSMSSGRYRSELFAAHLRRSAAERFLHRAGRDLSHPMRCRGAERGAADQSGPAA